MDDVNALKARIEAWRTWCAHALGESADKTDKYTDDELRVLTEAHMRKYTKRTGRA